MKQSEIQKIAEHVAAKRFWVETLRQMNRPADIQERIKVEAAYMIANDELSAANQRYASALREFLATPESER